MPSPFPGMDPYLESPEIFPDVHDSMITYLREALQASLPARILLRSDTAFGSRYRVALWVPTSKFAIPEAVQHLNQRPACRGRCRRSHGKSCGGESRT